jgi:predicted lysophospholipase L1 biosynthesis ABC-type transport system permease subunit
VAAGVGIAWGLCKWTFDIDFLWSGIDAAETVLLALLLMLGFGALVTLRVLAAKAAPYLRGE